MLVPLFRLPLMSARPRKSLSVGQVLRIGQAHIGRFGIEILADLEGLGASLLHAYLPTFLSSWLNWKER